MIEPLIAAIQALNPPHEWKVILDKDEEKVHYWARMVPPGVSARQEATLAGAIENPEPLAKAFVKNATETMNGLVRAGRS